jgi:hypothetical protein
MNMNQKLLVNLGSGVAGTGWLPAMFDGWRQLRVDIDPAARPDIVGSLTDLSALESECADAVWASHCVEHIYRHEVHAALTEMRRVMKMSGLLCIRVPDLQTVAGFIAADRMHEVIYDSPAGPVTPHDVVFGLGSDVALGYLSMAHKTGFTPTLLVQSLNGAGFESFLIRRTPDLELVAIARKQRWTDESEPTRIVDALGL